MLLEQPYYVEVVTWKRATIDGVLRVWCNSYQFVSAEPLTDGTAELLCHNLATAEIYIHPPDTMIFGVVAWTWLQLEKISAPGSVYIWPDHRFGVRDHQEGQSFIPWEYALSFEKMTTHGRSGRMAFRHTLLEAETVPYKDGGRAIPHALPYGAHHTNLITYWLNNTPLNQAILERESELSYPLSYRPVTGVSIGTLSKLQSVEDAQSRKTPRALPYKHYWEESLLSLFMNVGAIYDLVRRYPDGMSKDDVPILSTMAGELKGNLTYLQTYWTEGVKPVLMLNWRPTSGLDPYSMPAQSLAGDALGLVDGLAQLIDDITSYPELFVPMEAVMPFIQAYSYIALLYDRIGVMRWTGTPIRGLPKVYE